MHMIVLYKLIMQAAISYNFTQTFTMNRFENGMQLKFLRAVKKTYQDFFWFKGCLDGSETRHVLHSVFKSRSLPVYLKCI